MKRVVVALLTLAFAMLFAGGCAKQELVKKDSQLATAPAAKPAQDQPRPTQASPATKPAAAVQQTETTKPAAAANERAQSSLARIYFSFDSSMLSDEARSILKENADYLKKNSTLSVRIEGNCDERGSDEYNLALGEKRALAARQYLVTLGAPANRLTVISYGKEKPAAPGHDEAAWAKNRRDEFVVTAH